MYSLPAEHAQRYREAARLIRDVFHFGSRQDLQHARGFEFIDSGRVFVFRAKRLDQISVVVLARNNVRLLAPAAELLHNDLAPLLPLDPDII